LSLPAHPESNAAADTAPIVMRIPIDFFIY
jgi:hypothetical protein